MITDGGDFAAACSSSEMACYIKKTNQEVEPQLRSCVETIRESEGNGIYLSFLNTSIIPKYDSFSGMLGDNRALSHDKSTFYPDIPDVADDMYLIKDHDGAQYIVVIYGEGISRSLTYN